ncbi:hypothetical protein [Thermoproteus tenax]|uniref:hypothetical protein n=1 Tax=Thermoproteus tenax TaxID=2271 RepID=UPI0014330A03|nr:hypothetical protein [Thermoproteus tenax]
MTKTILFVMLVVGGWGPVRFVENLLSSQRSGRAPNRLTASPCAGENLLIWRGSWRGVRAGGSTSSRVRRPAASLEDVERLVEI